MYHWCPVYTFFFSAVLSGVRKCFGAGKRLNILGNVRNYSLGRIAANGLFHSNMGDKKYLGLSTSRKATHLVAGTSEISLFLFFFPE